ncbi:Ger(x)C family spore germination protein [Bacillus sp. CLL-7-23]|uniref:Ger(X)C family spore germination protein n=1 Tax=Bacillus changyiensis TaxID=3004103 RepID=A0ABT4X6F8_9BACI|nr:Ger(x)C family spore germination protein [Bacillus changyiensis]MDA7027853.1 Ger(x)C family spore germination protein [Bacillus changyiensis]
METITNTLRFLSICLLFFLSGCWSSREIEELGLTFAIGMDKGKETSIEKKFNQVGGNYPKHDEITLTYQYVNQQTAGAKAAGGGGGGDQKSYINIYQTGDATQQNVREVALRKDRPVFGPHLKVIVIAADLLRTYSLEELLDQYLRDDEIRPSSLVLVTRGKARDTLELKDVGEMPAFRLREIINNRYRAKKILPPITLAKLTGMLRSGTSYLLQNVAAADGEIKYAGAVAINGKTNKLLGYLDEHDLDGLMWIKGKGTGGTVTSYEDKTKKLTVYTIETLKSEIKPIVKGNRLISFDVNITSDGHLAENRILAEKAFDNKFLERVEKNSEKTARQSINHSIEEMQKKYKADLAGFGNSVRIHEPRLWEKLKKNWDEIFTEIPIKFHVDLTIKDYGTVGDQ